ncbi:MAG: hypothetical protein JXB20_05565, partial [Bacilli bacterium]|nr:hypothetical protein [Bacilli bacterium]
MNFKKFAFLGLVMIALLAFAGCNGETTTATTASTTAATTTTVSTTATTTEPTTVTTATTVSELTDAEKAQAVLDALDLGDLTAVTADLTLPSPTTDGVAVTWATSDAAVITAAGVITTPRYGQGDATATLTATATLNDAAPTRQFTVVVAEESVSAYLTRIGNSIIITNSDAITADFLIPGAYGSGDAQATITWVSGNTDIATVSAAVDEDGFYTVTVTRPKADDGGVNTSVILTATIAIGEDDLEVQKTILVLAESSSTPVTTIAEGMELPFGTNVKWEDMTVFGIDEAGFFFTDGTDLMYVYGSDYAAQVTVGEVYDIIGPISLYNAVPEVQDAGSVVVKINDSEATARTLAPTTATIAEIIANHEGYDSADPMKFGYYTVTAKSFYYDHLKGDNYNTYLVPTDATVLDKEEAIRVYYKSNKAAVEALHGETITLNIVIFAFNSGADYGDWYADFLGTADDITVAFASDQDAVDAALATLQFPNAILEATTLDLPASIYGVDLTYASTDAAVISPTTGVVDLTSLTTQVSVDLTVSAAKGSATGQQVFTIKVGELPLLDIATALTKADGEIIKVQGVVTKVDSNNFFIQDATGGMMVYQGSSSTFTSLAVPGNLVEIEGELDFY